MTDADTSEWRTAFEGYNGGEVDVVGWERDPLDDADSLSFWIAVGQNGHQACAYTTKHPAGLVDALKSRLGTPDSFDQVNEVETTTAFWKQDGWEYAYSQISSFCRNPDQPGSIMHRLLSAGIDNAPPPVSQVPGSGSEAF